MFTLVDFVNEKLKKYVPKLGKRLEEPVNSKVLLIILDLFTLLGVVAGAIFLPQDTLMLINSKFESLITTLILSIIISAAISGILFNKKNKDTSTHHKNGIKLLLMGVPMLIVFIPVFTFQSQEIIFYKIAMVTYYIVFNLLVKIIMGILGDVYREKVHD